MNIASILKIDGESGRVTLLVVEEGDVFRIKLTQAESNQIDHRLPRGAVVNVEVAAERRGVSVCVAPPRPH